jgi:hypothetical protein
MEVRCGLGGFSQTLNLHTCWTSEIVPSIMCWFVSHIHSAPLHKVRVAPQSAATSCSCCTVQYEYILDLRTQLLSGVLHKSYCR